MLVFETLKNKISHFLNSNTCFCSRLYGNCEPYHAFTNDITDKFWLMDFCFQIQTGYHLKSNNQERNFDHLGSKNRSGRKDYFFKLHHYVFDKNLNLVTKGNMYLSTYCLTDKDNTSYFSF